MDVLIPWLDVTRQNRWLQPRLLPLVDGLMAGSSYLHSHAVDHFEAEFARFVGARHCIGLNSGTSALRLALLACGIGPGDQVITSAVTSTATCRAICDVGARPIFVDIEPSTYCLDPEQLKVVITPRAKAILPVHLYGQPADMAAINTITDKHGLVVIEDACQAHAATLTGRHAGTFGRIGCFSFYPGKNLSGHGDAGAIVTDDDDLAEQLRRFRDRAPSRQRMEAFQAALLSIKLPQLQGWTESRQHIAERYISGLADVACLRLPAERPGARHNRHIFAVCCDQRDALRRHLARQSIQTTLHYPSPLHLQAAFRHLGYGRGTFPVAEELCRSELTLPMFAELTHQEVDRVIDAVHAWTAVGTGSLVAV
jgi:dTDP-4-amino-4,6-dideoxygalactose transaminase